MESLIELRDDASKKCWQAAIVIGIGLLANPLLGWALNALFHIPDGAASTMTINVVALRIVLGLVVVIGGYFFVTRGMMYLSYSSAIKNIEAEHSRDESQGARSSDINGKA